MKAIKLKQKQRYITQRQFMASFRFVTSRWT